MDRVIRRPHPATVLAMDGLAFLMTVACVILLDWQVRDVIWGLWTCSLCVGYTFIVTVIVASVVHARGSKRFARIATGVFLLGFFTVHFGMFHFVHSVFLNVFFPLVPEGRGFPDFFAMLSTALGSYWPLVLTTFISRFSDFPFQGMDLKSGDVIKSPYVNVVRMHILIFVFAGLHVFNLSQFAIYPVLALYFVPWGELRRFVSNIVRAGSACFP